MRKLFFAMSVTAFMLVMPGVAQASEGIETVEATGPAAQDLTELLDSGELATTTKYAKCKTGVYETPNENSIPRDYSAINTSFEVVSEADGWSMITTQDGFAFILSDTLSDTLVETKTYTDSDLYIMAHLLAGECQSCPDEEQLYVGSVVLNRVNSSEFPNTIEAVVFQKGQYACTRDGNYYREPTERNWANAKWLLENGSVLPENVIWQSGGRQGRGVYLKTKWHYYCY